MKFKVENVPVSRRLFNKTAFLVFTSPFFPGCERKPKTIEDFIIILGDRYENLPDIEKKRFRKNWEGTHSGAIEEMCAIYSTPDNFYNEHKGEIDNFNVDSLGKEQLQYYGGVFPWIKDFKALKLHREQNNIPSPDEIAISRYERLITAIMSN